MNVSYFIGISSAVLLTWLGVTFFQQIPQDRHPKQGRLSSETLKIFPVENKETITTTVSVNE
jgi:hypothetical protein